LLRAKLHHGRITAADVNYVGSISIDANLLKDTGILPWERVMVADIENGNRLETYVVEAPPGSGIIQMNGAAAPLRRRSSPPDARGDRQTGQTR